MMPRPALPHWPFAGVVNDARIEPLVERIRHRDRSGHVGTQRGLERVRGIRAADHRCEPVPARDVEQRVHLPAAEQLALPSGIS